MARARGRVLFLAVCIGLAAPASAQEFIDSPSPLGERLHRPPEGPAGGSEFSSDEPRIDAAGVDERLLVEFLRDDDSLQQAYRELLRARIERETQILLERRDVLRWTNWISRAIFAVVHVILALALRAAFGEFAKARRVREEKPGETELRISLEGVALKTSLHGIVLLGAALAFYFLYLRFVYPITEL